LKQYLSNIQPYMILRRKDQEPDQSFICVIDNIYRVSVYIKVDNRQFEEVVISFHENNKRGIAKTNSLIEADQNRYVPIFADSVLSCVAEENRYVVRAFIQRGLTVLGLDLAAAKCEDVFLVEKNGIHMQFLSYCNEYIRDLYTSDLDLDFNQIDVFTMLQQISFTSYGRDTFSSISLLIGSLCIQPDALSRGAADFALVTFVQQLSLTKEQAREMQDLLEEKFRVTSIRGIDLILDRVERSLEIAVEHGSV